MATTNKNFKVKNGLEVGGNGTFDGTVTVYTPTANTHAATKLYVDTVAGAGSFNQGFWGSFYDTTTQIATTANTAYAMTLNSYDPLNNGVTVVSGSRITIANAGVYNLQFSAQLDKTTNGTHKTNIWLRKNGTDVASSDGETTLGKDEKLIATWNYVFVAAANDYYELMWSTEDAGLRILAQAATTSPVRPEIPSLILTVTQVTYNQKGDTGNTGAGVATGGVAGDFLVKVNSTNYATTWSNATTAGIAQLSGATFTGNVAGTNIGLSGNLRVTDSSGTPTYSLEIGSNGISAYQGSSTPSALSLNYFGGDIYTGSGTLYGSNISATTFTGNVSANTVTTTGDITVNGGDILTNQTTATVYNTTATTVNIGRAATALGLGASTGVTTINNDLQVAGNITFTGNATTLSANDLSVSDPIIYIGANNTGHTFDLGVVGHFNDGTYQHTGIIRDATDNTWKLFSNVVSEPTTTVDFTNAVYDTLKLGNLTSVTSASNATIQLLPGYSSTIPVIQIGNKSNVASTPSILFNSGTDGTNAYDSAIAATGGTTADGQGKLDIYAANVVIGAGTSNTATVNVAGNLNVSTNVNATTVNASTRINTATINVTSNIIVGNSVSGFEYLASAGLVSFKSAIYAPSLSSTYPNNLTITSNGGNISLVAGAGSATYRTHSAGDNSTNIASTAYVDSAITTASALTLRQTIQTAGTQSVTTAGAPALVYAVVVGAGGGGGNGNNVNYQVGGGGGAGAIVAGWVPLEDTCFIGTGGSGASAAVAGTDGTASYYSGLFAQGGQVGGKAIAGAASTFGAGAGGAGNSTTVGTITSGAGSVLGYQVGGSGGSAVTSATAAIGTAGSTAISGGGGGGGLTTGTTSNATGGTGGAGQVGGGGGSAATNATSTGVITGGAGGAGNFAGGTTTAVSATSATGKQSAGAGGGGYLAAGVNNTNAGTGTTARNGSNGGAGGGGGGAATSGGTGGSGGVGAVLIYW